MIDDYGSTLVPYGVNRAVKHATGRTFEDMYPSFVDTLRREFTAQADAIRARGLREGKRVTFGGYTAEHPRWIPANAWNGRAGDLLYYRDDANDRTGFYALPVTRDASGQVTTVDDRARELMIRTNGDGSASFTPDGGVVFSQTEITDNLFSFNDSRRCPAARRARTAWRGKRTRPHARVPRDGSRRLPGRATRRLRDEPPRHDLPRDRRPRSGGLSNTRTLVPGARFDQAFTPRWSPDGVHVAYSVWTRGGYRDVRIVDTRDGSFVNVTQDRALDQDPSYSADGKTLYFTSDRTGVMNVYAYDVATATLRQVTNVINGAYYPEASPDGKTLATATRRRASISSLCLSSRRPTSRRSPTTRATVASAADPRAPRLPGQPYNPLETLSRAPTRGRLGPETSATPRPLRDRDRHRRAHTSREHHERAREPEPPARPEYSYHGLPVDLNFHATGPSAPAAATRSTARTSSPTSWSRSASSRGRASPSPRPFDTQSFSVSYSFQRTAANLPVPVGQIDPYGIPSVPTRGYVGVAHLGWSYSSAEQYLWSVSAERGWNAGIGIDLSDGILASQYKGYDATANVGVYLKMPWLNHHVLALHGSVGTSGGGSRAGRYYVGGFDTMNIIDTLRNQLSQGGIVLRGYPVLEEEGTNYALFNSEYRFPICQRRPGSPTYPDLPEPLLRR